MDEILPKSGFHSHFEECLYLGVCNQHSAFIHNIQGDKTLNWAFHHKLFDTYWKLQFLKHLKRILLKLCPFFVSWFWSFVKRYEFDLKGHYWSVAKLQLGLDVRPEIPIIKGQFCTMHLISDRTSLEGIKCTKVKERLAKIILP